MKPSRIERPLSRGRIVALGVVALAAACTNTGVPGPAQLSGTYDLALVHSLRPAVLDPAVPDLMFVLSADHDELRVMDLTSPIRDWIRAPDPIEPLSIPVAQAPVGLVADIHYEDQNVNNNPADGLAWPGVETGGPFVYVHGYRRGDGEPVISVVGADRNWLKEICQIDAQLPVTALSARGPYPNDPPASLGIAGFSGGVSTVYYATGGNGSEQVYSVSLPADPAVLAATVDVNHQCTQVPTPLPVSLTGAGVSSLMALPDQGAVVIATRGNEGTTGQTLRYDSTTNLVTPYSFPAPVRQMRLNPGYGADEILPDGGLDTAVVSAGTRLYGVLDDSSCGFVSPCTGILAVDVDGGAPSLDSWGLPMLPIVLGSGLIQDFIFAPGASVSYGGSAAADTLYTQPVSSSSTATGIGAGGFSLLGVATSSDGNIYFFDGAGLSYVDNNFDAPTVTSISLEWDGGTTDVNGNPLNAPAGFGPIFGSSSSGSPYDLTLVDGSARDDTVTVTFEGFLPGATILPTQASDGQDFPIDPAVAAAAQIEVGDFIELSDLSLLCQGEVTVSSIGALPGGGYGLTTNDPIPSTCADRDSYGVRAGPADPYVLTSVVLGYVGRSHANGSAVPLNYPVFSRPPPQLTVEANVYTAKPPIGVSNSVGFVTQDPNFAVRDTQYVITVVSNFSPLFFQLDTSVFPFFDLPWGLTNTMDFGAQSGIFFVSYPSANALIAFTPAEMTANSANSAGVSTYQ